MRAIAYSTLGTAAEVLALHDVEVPEPKTGEVRVALTYSGVNPSDAKSRGGARPGVTKPAFDLVIPHSDGSGVIDAVGSGVDPARIGERVWIWNGQWQRAFGTAAEAIVLPTEQAVKMPGAVSFETGATLGIPGLTAAHTIFSDGDVTGQVILISGGAGAVGHNAVQLAKWGGAAVIATASPSAFERVKAAGADHVLDYRAPDLAEQILKITSGKGVDRAVEVEYGVNAALLGEVVRVNGRICVYGSAIELAPTIPFGVYLFKAVRVEFALVYILEAEERAVAIQKLHDALTAGALVPAVHEVMPLENAIAAHERVMTGGRNGAVLLKI